MQSGSQRRFGKENARRRQRSVPGTVPSHFLVLHDLEERILFAAATQVIFSTFPSNVAATSFMSPGVSVVLADGTGATATGTSATATVLLNILQGPVNTFINNATAISVKAVNGIANFTSVAFSTPGSYILTASSGSLVNATSNTFLVTAAPTHLVVTTQPPATANAGTGFTITVAIEDANNQIVTTDNSTVNASIVTGPAGAVFSGGSSQTFINGVATFHTTLNQAGTWRLGFSDTNSAKISITSANTNTFTVAAGALSTLVFTQQPTNVGQSNVMTPPVTVALEDSFGNVINTNTNVTLSLKGGPAGAALNVSATSNAGVATFSGLSFSIIGNYILQATSGGITAVSNSFAVTGPPAQLGFVTQPTQATQGASIPSFTVAVEDAAGNIVTSDNSQVTIQIFDNSSGGTLSGTTIVNASNGQATFTGLSIDTRGRYSFEVTDGALQSATSNTFLINGLASQIVFTALPGQTNSSNLPLSAAAGVPASPIQVTIEDSDGNRVAGDNSTVNIALNGTGSISGTTSAVASNGIATFTNVIFTTPGTYSLAATDGSFNATSPTFTIAAAASKLRIVQQPVNTANKSPMTQVVVDVLDANGNIVTSNTSTVILSIKSGPDGGTMSGATPVSNKAVSSKAVAGVATFSNLTFGLQGQYTLIASDGNLATDTSLPFTITPQPTKVTFQVQPISTVAGVTLANIVARIRDFDSNLVSSDRSTVTLGFALAPTVSGLTPAFTIAGNTTPAATVTAVVSGGYATFSGIKLTVAGKYRLVLSDGALTGATSNAFTILPEISSAHVVVTQSPTATLVTKPFSPPVIAAVEDEFKNIVTSAHSAMTISITSGQSISVLKGQKTVHAVNGVAKFSGLSVNQAGSYTFKISDPSLVANPTASFNTAVNPSLTTINVPAHSATYPAHKPITWKVNLGQAVPISTPFDGTVKVIDNVASGNVFTLVSGTGIVHAGGNASLTINNLSAGTYTVRVEYVPANAINPSHSGALSAPFTITVGPSTLTLKASASSVLTGQTVLLSATIKPGPGAVASPNGGTVNFYDGSTFIASATVSNGTAVLPVTPLTAGAHHYRAGFVATSAFAEADSNAAVVTARLPATTMAIPAHDPSYLANASFNLSTTLVSSPASNVPFTGTVSVVDQNNNVLVSQAAQSNGQTGTLNITGLTPGNYTLRVVYGGDVGHAAATSSGFAIVVGPDTTMLGADKQSLTNGDTLTLTATINPLLGATAPVTGVVTFKDNGVDVGTASIASNAAVLQIVESATGSHQYLAVYGGDSNYIQSTSLISSVTVT